MKSASESTIMTFFEGQNGTTSRIIAFILQWNCTIIPLALPRLTQRIHSRPLNFIIYDALDLENASLHPVIDDSFFEHTIIYQCH